MHLRFFHSLHDPVDSWGTQDYWNPGGKPAGVVQDKNDLLFIIVGHVFDLNPHQGEAQWLCPSTAQSYQWNTVPGLRVWSNSNIARTPNLCW